MKRALLISISVFVMLEFCYAQEPAPTPSRLEIKNKSSFKSVERNPFWPIGWKPAATTSSGDADHGSEIPETAFMLSSITIEKAARFAIINGKILQEGQQFALQMGTSTYSLTVKAIQDGRVILARHDQEIVIPLRRK